MAIDMTFAYIEGNFMPAKSRFSRLLNLTISLISFIFCDVDPPRQTLRNFLKTTISIFVLFFPYLPK